MKKQKPEQFSFFLSGDLRQMATKGNFLNRYGIETKQNNVYPCLKPSDVKRALSLIWEHKVEGWWHYEDKYVKYKICTKEEFKNGF